MFGVSLLWGWTRFAGLLLLLLGFCGMLRPDEFLSASRRDFVLPSGRPEVSDDAFLRIALSQDPSLHAAPTCPHQRS